MRKIKYLLISMLLFLPLSIDALSGSANISCNKTTLGPGESTTCSLTGTSVGEIDSFEAKLRVSSNLSIESITSNNIWQGDCEGNFCQLYSDNNKSGTFSVASFNIKAGNVSSTSNETIYVEGVVLLNSITLETVNGSSNSTNIAVKVKSSVNTLSALSISNGTLSPAFSSSVTSYTASTNESSVTVSATRTDPSSILDGAKTYTLDYGKNTINVVVTSETGDKKTYTIEITRNDIRENINTLSAIDINQGTLSPSFSPSTINYTVAVGSNITSIKVTPTKNGSKSSFVSGFSGGTTTLDYGANKIVIKVKSEKEEVKTYTITVTRKDDRSTNNYLKTLTLSEEGFKFDRNTVNYTLTVKNEVESIRIEATAEDDLATIEGTGKFKLKEGKNVLEIDVRAENEKVRTYKITVTRLTKDQGLSSNVKLTKLEVTGYSLGFDPDILTYTLKLKEKDISLLFDYVTEDDTTTVSVEDNDNLRNGSVVKLNVTSTDGTVKTYTINIQKDEITPKSGVNTKTTKSSTSTWKIVIGVLSVVVIVGGIIVFFIVKKKRMKELDE